MRLWCKSRPKQTILDINGYSMYVLQEQITLDFFASSSFGQISLAGYLSPSGDRRTIKFEKNPCLTKLEISTLVKESIIIVHDSVGFVRLLAFQLASFNYTKYRKNTYARNELVVTTALAASPSIFVDKPHSVTKVFSCRTWLILVF
jgi:hypothetical protein